MVLSLVEHGFVHIQLSSEIPILPLQVLHFYHSSLCRVLIALRRLQATLQVPQVCGDLVSELVMFGTVGPHSAATSQEGEPLACLCSTCQHWHRDASNSRNVIGLGPALLRWGLCFNGQNVSRQAICLLI